MGYNFASCHKCGRDFAVGEEVTVQTIGTIDQIIPSNSNRVAFSEKRVLICGDH